MGLIGKMMGLKKNLMWLGKSMNGADLPVFLFEINEANPVFYLYFKQKRAMLYCNIQLRSDKVK